MYGSILINCWGSLIAFTITFIWMYQNSVFPSHILIVSFIVAFAAFLLFFAVRYLIGYITYTPNDEMFEEFIEEAESEENDDDDENLNEGRTSSKVEFQDESPEDIAKIVRTMMQDQDA